MKEPLLVPAIALTVGVWAGQEVGLSFGEAAYGGAALFGLSFGSSRLGGLCRALAWLAAGAAVAAWHPAPKAPRLNVQNGEAAILEGCVVEPTDADPERARFTLELEPGARVQVTMGARTGEKPPRVEYGQRIRVEARVRLPRNFRNPGDFDSEGYLARRGVFWTATSRLGEQPEVLGGGCGDAGGWVVRMRSAGLQRVDALFPDAQRRGMLRALLLGDNSGLDADEKSAFQQSGTYHALVVSGAHISVLAGLLLWVMRRGFVPEMAALAVAGVAAWVYAVVAGGGAPAIRSAAFFSLYLVGRFFYRRGRVLNMLAAVLIVVLAADPGQLKEGSFQLSFLCVAAIAALAAPVIEMKTSPWRQAARWLREERCPVVAAPAVQERDVELRLAAETVSLGLRLPEPVARRVVGMVTRILTMVLEMALLTGLVQFALALPMALLFHRVPVTGLTANLVVVPLLTAAIPTGFAALATGWGWMATGTGWLVDGAAWVASWHMRWEPGWRTPDPPWGLGAGIALALTVLAVALRKRPGWAWAPGLAVAVGLTALVVHPFPADVERGWLEIDVLDVGQGDSLLVVFPRGQTLLVDAGGFPAFPGRPKPRLEVGEDVVSPYLWRRGIRRLDYVAVTHDHADHAGGMAAVVANFRPREMWTGALPQPERWQEVPKRRLRRGDRLEIDGVEVKALSPGRDAQAGAAGKNNDSLVLLLRYGRHTALLMGDAEQLVEREMAGGIGRVDVLKVGHHGSRTATGAGFLEETRPAVALISVGELNSYGLPHERVMRELAERHVMVGRTDRDGLMRVRSDGRYLEMGSGY